MGLVTQDHENDSIPLLPFLSHLVVLRAPTAPIKTVHSIRAIIDITVLLDIKDIKASLPPTPLLIIVLFYLHIHKSTTLNAHV